MQDSRWSRQEEEGGRSEKNEKQGSAEGADAGSCARANEKGAWLLVLDVAKEKEKTNTGLSTNRMELA